MGGRSRSADASTTRYLKSWDGVQWLDQGFFPAGPAGSHDDRDRLAPGRGAVRGQVLPVLRIEHEQPATVGRPPQMRHRLHRGGRSRRSLAPGDGRSATATLRRCASLRPCRCNQPEDGVPERQVVHVLQGPEGPRRRDTCRIPDRERGSRVGSAPIPPLPITISIYPTAHRHTLLAQRR